MGRGMGGVESGEWFRVASIDYGLGFGLWVRGLGQGMG